MLFISHSSDDLPIVQALVAFLESALDISATQLRCTSLDGYRFEGGVHIDERLRQEVHEARAFIGLISPSSLRSTYVSFELGARWGAGKHLIPLLAPGTDATILKPPLSALHALSCASPAQLRQLVEQLAGTLGVALRDPAAFEQDLDRLAQLPVVPGKWLIPDHAVKRLKMDYAERRERLSPNQKAILAYLEADSEWRFGTPQQVLETEFQHLRPVFWRLEALGYQGFVERVVTDRRGTVPTHHYSLSPPYRAWYHSTRSPQATARPATPDAPPADV